MRLLFILFCCFLGLKAENLITCDYIKNNKAQVFQDSPKQDYLDIASTCDFSLKNQALPKDFINSPMKFAVEMLLVVVLNIFQNYKNLTFCF